MFKNTRIVCCCILNNFCCVFAQKLVVNNCTLQTQSESRNFLRPNGPNFKILPKMFLNNSKIFVKTGLWKTIKGEIFEIDTCKKNVCKVSTVFLRLNSIFSGNKFTVFKACQTRPGLKNHPVWVHIDYTLCTHETRFIRTINSGSANCVNK
jgi:hypothetical protein